MEYELGQIIEFTTDYPEGLYDFVIDNGYTLTELEPTEEARRVQIVEIPQPTPEQERERLDSLTLTPADVERALYKAKGMDFEDLKTLIAQSLPQVDLKGLAIEFRAKDFYRGATTGGMRLFDVVGQLLGYTIQDMDYLFENKELPSANNNTVE